MTNFTVLQVVGGPTAEAAMINQAAAGADVNEHAHHD